jgi:hypothetical protein
MIQPLRVPVKSGAGPFGRLAAIVTFGFANVVDTWPLKDQREAGRIRMRPKPRGAFERPGIEFVGIFDCRARFGRPRWERRSRTPGDKENRGLVRAASNLHL